MRNPAVQSPEHPRAIFPVPSRSPLPWVKIAFLVMLSVAPTVAATLELPAWVNTVGTRTSPVATTLLSANQHSAVSDGKTLNTAAIQSAIDAASAAGGGVVALEPGTYLTGALFLKSNVHLRIDAGVTLLGTQDERAYPRI